MASIQDVMLADQSRVSRANQDSASGRIAALLQGIAQGQATNQALEGANLDNATKQANLQSSGFPVQKNSGISGLLRMMATGSQTNVDPSQYQQPSTPEGFTRVGGKYVQDPTYMNPKEKAESDLYANILKQMSGQNQGVAQPPQQQKGPVRTLADITPQERMAARQAGAVGFDDETGYFVDAAGNPVM